MQRRGLEKPRISIIGLVPKISGLYKFNCMGLLEYWDLPHRLGVLQRDVTEILRLSRDLPRSQRDITEILQLSKKDEQETEIHMAVSAEIKEFAKNVDQVTTDIGDRIDRVLAKPALSQEDKDELSRLTENLRALAHDPEKPIEPVGDAPAPQPETGSSSEFPELPEDEEDDEEDEDDEADKI